MKKVILITGCSSGIGEYTSNKYLENENCTVIGLDINPCNISSPNFTFYQIDLTEEEPTKKVFDNFNKIDLAINNAGVYCLRKPIIEFSATEITKSWQENFLSCFTSLKFELEIMKKSGGGKIINIASLLGHVAKEESLAYSVAKAGIINMTKVAAIENSNFNIKINSISPATIDTPMIRNQYGGKLKDYTNLYYTKHCGSPNDVYTIIKMLEDNNFMTGSDIKIDGGLTELFKI